MSIVFTTILVPALFLVESARTNRVIMEKLERTAISRASSMERVTLEAGSSCIPGGEEQCKYKAINKEAGLFEGLFEGQRHQKVGKGNFGEALLVHSLENGRVDDAREYVWKRFDMEKEGVTAVLEKAREVMSVIKGLNCPHTLLPLDTKPEVVVDKKFGSDTHKDNGFIFDKMNGHAEYYWSHHSQSQLELCGPTFLQQMLAALGCLRQAGYEHTDVKLDNILYKIERTREGWKDCPSWYLTDFDLLSPIGGPPSKYTPPLKALEMMYLGNAPVWSPRARWQEINGQVHDYGRLNHILRGTEDFYCLALAYESLDQTTTDAEVCNFFTFVQAHLDCTQTPELQLRSNSSFDSDSCTGTQVAIPEFYPGLGYSKGWGATQDYPGLGNSSPHGSASCERITMGTAIS